MVTVLWEVVVREGKGSVRVLGGLEGGEVLPVWGQGEDGGGGRKEVAG